MTFEDQLRHVIKSKVDDAVPPLPNAEAVMRQQRAIFNPRVVAIPVAVVAIVGGVLGGFAVIDDDATKSDPEPLGSMDYSHGLRAYKSPDGPVFIGGRQFRGSDLGNIDTDGTATPHGIVYFDDGRAHLLDEDGKRTPIGPETDDAPESFHPSAKADATRPLAAWTEYEGDRVVIRMYDFEKDETVATYAVDCGSKCAKVQLDAVDSGYAFIKTSDGTYVWDAAEDGDDLTQVAGPRTDVVDVHAKTMLYSGRRPEPAPEGPIDDSWTFVKGAIDAELSHDGRHILYWSPKLKPVRAGGNPIRLDAKGLGFYTFDTDGSVLAGTFGSPAKIYDCELPSGKCTRLKDLPTRSGDPMFVGNDM